MFRALLHYLGRLGHAGPAVRAALQQRLPMISSAAEAAEAVSKAVANADATLLERSAAHTNPETPRAERLEQGSATGGDRQKRILEIKENHQQKMRMLQEIERTMNEIAQVTNEITRATDEIMQVARELAAIAMRRSRRDSGVGF